MVLGYPRAVHSAAIEGQQVADLEHALATAAPDQKQLRQRLLAIRDSYREDTRAFLGYLAETGQPLTFDALKAYARHLQRAGYAAGTITKRLAGAKHRIRWLFERTPEALDLGKRYRIDQELRKVKPPEQKRRTVEGHQVLFADEVKRLIENTSPRVGLMLEFLFLTGARVSEMAGVRLEDLRLEDGFVAARIIGKGSKERVLKLPSELVDRCRETFAGSQWLLETSGGKPYRREYVSNQIKHAGQRVLDRNISAHTLRHSFASLKIARTGKIKAVSEYLGHSTTSITLDMYVHESLDMSDLSAGW